MVVRQHVFSFWRGPQSIDALVDTTKPFWGWQVLSLETRIHHGLDPEFESRSVYGVPHNADEPHAILRAVYWNHAHERQEMNGKGFNYSFGMPARFVQVSAAQSLQWIQRFKGINALIDPTWGNDSQEPIRRLRIESDYSSSTIETTWKSGRSVYKKIDGRWESVWNEMSEILKSAPVVTRLAEDYRAVIGVPRFDLEAYRPDAFGQADADTAH
jgi:hypothetical protein